MDKYGGDETFCGLMLRSIGLISLNHGPNIIFEKKKRFLLLLEKYLRFLKLWFKRHFICFYVVSRKGLNSIRM